MKNILIYKYLLLQLFLFSAIANTFSQINHEFSIAAGIGMSSFKYTTSIGKPTIKPGGLAGFDYGFLFHKNWGLITGIELNSYNSALHADPFNSVQKNLIDDENYKFDYHSKVSDYYEKQYILLLSVPLQIQFQTDGNTKFYVSAGLKIGIPVYNKFKGSHAFFVNKGYYYEQNNWLESQQFRGFGAFTGHRSSGDYDLKLAYIGTLESGIKWKIDRFVFYTGIYLDYGFNNIIDYHGYKDFIRYNSEYPYDFYNQGILKSTQVVDGNSVSITDKVVPFAFGLKFRYVLNCKKNTTPKIIQNSGKDLNR